MARQTQFFHPGFLNVTVNSNPVLLQYVPPLVSVFTEILELRFNFLDLGFSITGGVAGVS